MSEEWEDDSVSRARQRRIEEMRRSKEKQLQFRRNFKRIAPAAAGALALLLLVGARITASHASDGEQRRLEGKNSGCGQDLYGKENDSAEGMPETGDLIKSLSETVTALPKQVLGAESLAASGMSSGELSGETPKKNEKAQGKGSGYAAEMTSFTAELGDEEISSQYAILIDLESGEILAGRDAFEVINPASMTKILTALVAAEHVEDLDDTFTITLEITDYGYVHDCSSAGFERDEVVTVRDLFYGTILPSGADAAVGLATYVAGSQEAFVDMMNGKLRELGLSKTAHVTNCVGVYDEEHHCTAYDMAVIMEAALENELCREVLSARTYTTSKTEQHPEGLELSNWFLRRIEDRDTGGEVLCGKTGYVVQSGNCAASYGVNSRGKGYVCVTASGSSVWRCIEDHTFLYRAYAEEGAKRASGSAEDGD